MMDRFVLLAASTLMRSAFVALAIREAPARNARVVFSADPEFDDELARALSALQLGRPDHGRSTKT
jgi:hypothetical protein